MFRKKASRFTIWQKDHSDNEIGGIQREWRWRNVSEFIVFPETRRD